MMNRQVQDDAPGARVGKGIPTSVKSSSGGPSAISAAFVPGRILLDAPESAWLNPLSRPCSSAEAAVGDLGPSWSSAIGGGLGRRGELDGDMAAMVARCGYSVGVGSVRVHVS